MRLMATVSAGAIIAASPALAEMDAVTTWQNWTSLAPDIEITAGETQETDTSLTLRDVTMRMNDGRNQIEVQVPEFSLTETATGGLIALITGDGQFEIRNPDELVVADLHINGLSLGVNDTQGLAVSVAAPLLGATLREATSGGEAQNVSAAIAVTDVQAQFADSGAGQEDRQIQLGLEARDLMGRLDIREIVGVTFAEMRFDQESVSINLFGDGPSALFEGATALNRDLNFAARVALGATDFGLSMEEEPYSEGVDNRMQIAFGFDNFLADHSGIVPAGAEQFPNGQDLVHDDLEVSVRYDLGNARGHVDVVETYTFLGAPNTDTLGGTLDPTNAGLSVVIDEAGLLSVNVSAQSGFSGQYSEAFGQGGDQEIQEGDASVSGLDYRVGLTMPIDNVMQNVMQGLPDGLAYSQAYSVAEAAGRFAHFETFEGNTNTITAFDGSIADVDAGMTITAAAIATSSQIGAAAGSFEEIGSPILSGALQGLGISLDVPINTQAASLPYDLSVGLASLELGEGVFDMVDPSGALDRAPMSFAAEATGMMRATTSPAALMSFGVGLSPIAVETLSITAALSALGAGIEAVGAFDVEETITGKPPVGEADVVATGLDAVLEAVSGMGLLSQGQLDEAAFLLGAFTQQQDDGSRTMRVEINDQAHLIVNGVRMQ